MPPKTLNGARTVTAYLTAKGAAEAMAFYADIFGALEVGERYVDQNDGRVGHAEFTIGDTTLMISDEYPEIGVLSPATLGGSPIMLNTYVDDVDASYAWAVAAGARGMREPTDQFYGSRSAQIIDPWGHRWSLETVIEGRAAPALVGFDAVPAPSADASVPAESAPRTERARALLHGPAQIGYLTIHVDDVGRARSFFTALFGWEIEDGHTDGGGGHIANIDPPGSISPKTAATAGSTVTLYFQVPDVAATAERVRALGGTVLSTTDYASGGNAECTDDQGTRFDLFQPISGYERQ